MTHISETHNQVLQLPVQLPGRKNGRKLVRAITAESIYRCILLFLDHILYHRAHFVHDAQSASRAVLAMNGEQRPSWYMVHAQDDLNLCVLLYVRRHFLPDAAHIIRSSRNRNYNLRSCIIHTLYILVTTCFIINIFFSSFFEWIFVFLESSLNIKLFKVSFELFSAF